MSSVMRGSGAVAQPLAAWKSISASVRAPRALRGTKIPRHPSHRATSTSPTEPDRIVCWQAGQLMSSIPPRYAVSGHPVGDTTGDTAAVTRPAFPVLPAPREAGEPGPVLAFAHRG